MIERIATVASTMGLHARPAAIFAEEASKQPVAVTIAAEGTPRQEALDASSILSVMSLGAACGTRVVLRAEGEGSETALAALVRVLETNYDAE